MFWPLPSQVSSTGARLIDRPYQRLPPAPLLPTPTSSFTGTAVTHPNQHPLVSSNTSYRTSKPACQFHLIQSLLWLWSGSAPPKISKRKIPFMAFLQCEKPFKKIAFLYYIGLKGRWSYLPDPGWLTSRAYNQQQILPRYDAVLLEVRAGSETGAIFQYSDSQLALLFPNCSSFIYWSYVQGAMPAVYRT